MKHDYMSPQGFKKCCARKEAIWRRGPMTNHKSQILAATSHWINSKKNNIIPINIIASKIYNVFLDLMNFIYLNQGLQFSNWIMLILIIE